MPVASRATSGAETSRSGTGRPAGRGLRDAPLPFAGSGRGASTIVFHSPQPPQRPDHVKDSWPQDWQKNEVGARAIAASLRTSPDASTPPCHARVTNPLRNPPRAANTTATPTANVPE